jgi:type I restriction enzyme S subunit
MKEGWEMKQWAEVLEIRSGRNQKEVLNPNGKYPILGSAGKIMGYADDYICEEGTTIIGRKGTINSPLFITQKFWNVDTAFGLHAMDELDKNYLHYFCLSFDFTEMDRGSGRPSLVKSDLLKIQIPIPPLPEQKQIVAILDKAFAAIDQAQANIEKNIESAKELFQSKLNDIFSHPSTSSGQDGDGWEERKLNEICEVKDGTHDSPKYVDEKDGIPFVTQKNILDEGLSFESTKFISVSDHESFYKRSNVAFKDILFAMIGANRGMACIVDDKRTFSIKNVGLIKSNESYRPKYLLYYLKSPLAQKYVDENSSGSAQGFIGLGKLRAFPIPFTDIETQEKIESQIESLNECIISTISFYNQKLTNLEDLKKSILQKAFSGVLTSTGSATTQKPVVV